MSFLRLTQQIGQHSRTCKKKDRPGEKKTPRGLPGRLVGRNAGVPDPRSVRVPRVRLTAGGLRETLLGEDFEPAIEGPVVDLRGLGLLGLRPALPDDRVENLR